MYSDFSKLKGTVAEKLPFPHLLCPEFVRMDLMPDIHQDFPKVPGAGSFPMSVLKCGKAFQTMIEEISSPTMADILGKKLHIDLSGKPSMVTVRGFCRATDGKIHTDSRGKLITVLIYLNTDWDEKTGGRLRLLNNGDDIEDYFLESPPGNGTLLAFRCDKNAWHGHLPYEGQRRAIQLNWVESESYRRREASRHFVSASLKKVRAFAKLK